MPLVKHRELRKFSKNDSLRTFFLLKTKIVAQFLFAQRIWLAICTPWSWPDLNKKSFRAKIKEKFSLGSTCSTLNVVKLILNKLDLHTLGRECFIERQDQCEQSERLFLVKTFTPCGKTIHRPRSERLHQFSLYSPNGPASDHPDSQCALPTRIYFVSISCQLKLTNFSVLNPLSISRLIFEIQSLSWNNVWLC